MKTLFSMRYDIGPKAAETDLFQAAETVCRDWIHGVASRYTTPVPIPPDREYLMERDRVRLESWYYEGSDGAAMLRLLLDHPDHDKAFLQWKIDVALLQSQTHDVAVRIRIDIASIDDTITVPQFSFDKPRLVNNLLERFKLTYGGYPVTDKAIRIKASELDKLEEFIFRGSRDFPIVAISPLNTGATSIDIAPLVRRLTGIAYVCVFDAPATADQFRARVGYEWSCYNGAARIYWPKARKDGNSRRHRFWTAFELRGMEPEAFATKLLQDITEAAAFGSASERDIARVEVARRKAAEARSDERIAQLRSMLDEAKERGSQVLSEKEAMEERAREQAEWTRILEADLDDKEAIKRDNEELHRQLLDKEALIEHLRYALDQNSESCAAADIAPPESIEEAVNAVKQVSDEMYFLVLPDALDSARDSQFRNLPRVYKALLGLSHVAMLYHLGVEGKHSQDALRSFTQMDVAVDVSPTAKGKYRNHYEFMYGGQKVLAGPHIGTGRGGANDCFRAYWYVDEAKRRYVLCHVGEHLPDDSRN